MCVVVVFQGRVLSFTTVFLLSNKKDVQDFGAARGQTGTSWSTALVVGSSSWQRRWGEPGWEEYDVLAGCKGKRERERGVGEARGITIGCRLLATADAPCGILSRAPSPM